MIHPENIDIRKVSSTGYFFDPDGIGILKLSEDTILRLRNYYKDPSIACDVTIKKRYKLDRESINGLSRKISFSSKKIRFGVGTALVATSFIITMSSIHGKKEDIKIEVENQIEDSKLDVIASITDPVPQVEAYIIDPDTEENSIYQVGAIMDEHRLLIEKYASIYHVNPVDIYDKLVRITNNFTDQAYLNGVIPDLTCKGSNVVASSEEELILYFVRAAKQTPSEFGFNDSIKKDIDYKSSTDYVNVIKNLCEVLDEDPNLVYSIMQEETGFSSNMFMNKNNPAGLKKDGEWWSFSTKEEGIIELILEIKKYKRMGAKTIADIGAIHAPSEDDNSHWVDDVISIYNSTVNDGLFASKQY